MKGALIGLTSSKGQPQVLRKIVMLATDPQNIVKNIPILSFLEAGSVSSPALRLTPL